MAETRPRGRDPDAGADRGAEGRPVPSARWVDAPAGLRGGPGARPGLPPDGARRWTSTSPRWRSPRTCARRRTASRSPRCRCSWCAASTTARSPGRPPRAGISRPKDLEGQRVGVNRGYTVTTGVWARGILADQYGVDLDRVTWVLSGDEHVAEYRPPANVVPAGPDQDVPDLVASGELAAGVGVPADHARPDAADPRRRAGRATTRCATAASTRSTTCVVVKDELLAAPPRPGRRPCSRPTPRPRTSTWPGSGPGPSATRTRPTACYRGSWRSPAPTRCPTASRRTGP